MNCEPRNEEREQGGIMHRALMLSMLYLLAMTTLVSAYALTII